MNWLPNWTKKRVQGIAGMLNLFKYLTIFGGNIAFNASFLDSLKTLPVGTTFNLGTNRLKCNFKCPSHQHDNEKWV